MNAEQLLAHFDRISEAPDAIPRLRRFILDLAVRGKLVEQDPNDEPASDLLKRIRAEKARRLNHNRLMREQVLSFVDGEGLAFDVPVGWVWTGWKSIALKNWRHRPQNARYSKRRRSLRIAPRLPTWQQDRFRWSKACFT